MASVTPPNPLPANENIGPALVVLTCILTAVSVLTTGARWYVRIARRNLGWDDYTILAAVVLAIVRMAVQIMSVENGNGRHRWFITPDEYQNLNMYGWIAQIVLFPINCLEKISICLVVLRIKSTHNLRIFLYCVMVGLVIFNGVPVVILLAECNPVRTYWDSKAGHCWNAHIRTYVIYATIAYGILTDIICTTLPPIAVRKLQMPIKQKLLVCGLVGLGLIATACSIGRATSLSLSIVDLSWSYCIAAFWSNLELHIGIIASNLTVAPALYALVIGRSLFPTGNSQYNTDRSQRLHSVDTGLTGHTGPRSGSSSNKSDASVYGLQQGIRRDTDFYILEEDRSTYEQGLHSNEKQVYPKAIAL